MTTHTQSYPGRRSAAATPSYPTTAAAMQTLTGIAKRTAKLAGKVLMVGIMVVATAAFLFLAVGPRVFGYQTSTMLTGSMSPLINPGDVVVSVPTPVTDLKVGDIVTYHIPVEDQRIETHRITDVTRAGSSTTIQTKGDANNGADPWTATMAEDHAFTTVAVIPHLGDAIRALRSPVVGKVLLYGAPGILVLLLLTSIWSKPKESPASAHGTALPATIPS
ncbi:signal peptidase I [Pseudarthrobacter equi]|uniref:signal peptidase I n=1 Tax=Pseudarthrobacter equi TaxID=728066 RepID=UPI0028D7B5E4|nr:signal peptidase I [Pseudarthrobacter equi]